MESTFIFLILSHIFDIIIILKVRKITSLRIKGLFMTSALTMNGGLSEKIVGLTLTGSHFGQVSTLQNTLVGTLKPEKCHWRNTISHYFSLAFKIRYYSKKTSNKILKTGLKMGS